ncbi:transposase domain-containing protein [Saccharothrix yanglingensis]|uniref:transposase domain-containing protein n=1 Tax=Saccharothrix yanglingensis TaxID=659496 RepID=UPI003528EA89
MCRLCIRAGRRRCGGFLLPGHLGELTRHLPVELFDAIVEETQTVQRRMLRRPCRAGVCFVLTPALFPSLVYLRVRDRLTAGLGPSRHPRPSEKALRDLRRRRTVAFDGRTRIGGWRQIVRLGELEPTTIGGPPESRVAHHRSSASR